MSEDDQDRLPAGVSPEPWVIGKGRAPADEMAKRHEQALRITEAIQPATSRGVAYRLLNLGMIAGKDQFVRVVELVRNLRDSGLMPFDWITDEGRPLWLPAGFTGAANFIARQVPYFYMDAWAKAPVQVVVCVEKLALHGVFLPVAQEFDVPLVVTEGFCSLTRKHDLAELVKADRHRTIIVNLGDHDDSAWTSCATRTTGCST